MPGSGSKDSAPWEKLVVGGVYVILFVRSDPPQANDFHWGLYIHTERKGGYKYHIKTMGDGWVADHGATKGVFKSFLLVGLFHIATISTEGGYLGWIDGVMRTYDTNLNAPGITCRVWALWILELLQSNNVLGCDNLDALESEIFSFGNRYAADAANGKQPRPVKSSKICGGI